MSYYEILNKLGMIDDSLTEEVFNKDCSNILETMSIVDDLFINNDEATIKKFLVALLYKEN